jgi:RNA polymerase sigma-70 factor, ECF subfamily
VEQSTLSASGQMSPSTLAATYESYRPLLFSIAYRMTGSASEAEDILQEGYLRLHNAAGSADSIESPRAYLSTIVTRLSLDHLKRARVERERYAGPWLPEPVLTAPDPAEDRERRESVSLAFLVLLESLTPEERAAFLLHEVFDYPHDEIAPMIRKTPAACRQLLRRARLRLEERRGPRARFRASPEEHRRLVSRFLAAVERGDVQALAESLALDVVSVSDGGGKVHAARRPVAGRDAVLRFLSGLLRLAPPDTRFSLAGVNGEAALLTWIGDALFSVTTFETANGAIESLRIVVNPDKLTHIRSQITAGEQSNGSVEAATRQMATE